MNSELLIPIAYAVAVLGALSFLAKQVVQVLTCKDRMSKEFDSAVLWMTSVLFLLVAVFVISFLLNFSRARGYSISDSLEQWGQMGDFFGGMLNPILAFASFIALLYTIRIQSQIINETKTGQELAAFESAFFPLIDALRKDQRPDHETLERMTRFYCVYEGDVDVCRRSLDYLRHYRTYEYNCISFSSMFYECVEFLSEHKLAKPIHWTILANILTHTECYYIASLVGAPDVNVVGVSKFSKIASEHRLFRRSKKNNGAILFGNHFEKGQAGWRFLKPSEFGLEINAFTNVGS